MSKLKMRYKKEYYKVVDEEVIKQIQDAMINKYGLVLGGEEKSIVNLTVDVLIDLGYIDTVEVE